MGREKWGSGREVKGGRHPSKLGRPGHSFLSGLRVWEAEGRCINLILHPPISSLPGSGGSHQQASRVFLEDNRRASEEEQSQMGTKVLHNRMPGHVQEKEQA